MKNPWSVNDDMMLFVGPPGSGKTTFKTDTYEYLQDDILEHFGIPFKMVSARKFLEEWHLRDHQENHGKAHYTPGTPKEERRGGHSHANDPRTEQFTFMEQYPLMEAYKDFFRYLKMLPHDGTLYLVEWAAGTNGINDTESECVGIDASYRTQGELIKENPEQFDFTSRVRVVIHPETSIEQRKLLNQRREQENQERIAQGFASVFKSKTLMGLIEGDDFYMIEGMFKRVLNIENDGEGNFISIPEMTNVLLEILAPLYHNASVEKGHVPPLRLPEEFDSSIHLLQDATYVLKKELLPSSKISYKEYRHIHEILPSSKKDPIHEIRLAAEKFISYETNAVRGMFQRSAGKEEFGMFRRKEG